MDTVRGTFHVPQEKLNNMVTSMEEILLHRRVKARGLARVVGKLVAAYKSLGKDLVGLMTRDCYRAINFIGYYWDYFITMTSGAKREMSWWVQNLQQLSDQGREVQPSPAVTQVFRHWCWSVSDAGQWS